MVFIHIKTEPNFVRPVTFIAYFLLGHILTLDWTTDVTSPHIVLVVIPLIET